MAGRKQHFIPQGLLKGFEARRSGEKIQVFVCTSAKPPFIAATDGIAAERDFYSDPPTDGSPSLDDVITEFESKDLGRLISELRSAPAGQVNAESAALVVAHLAVRTAHIRATFGDLATTLFGSLRTQVGDVPSLRKLFDIDTPTGPPHLQEMIATELAAFTDRHLSTSLLQSINRMVAFRLREHFDRSAAVAPTVLSNFLDQLDSNVPEMVINAHTKALGTGLAPQSRLADLRRLSWEVVDTVGEDGHYILSDCVVISVRASDGHVEPYTLSELQEVSGIVMPVSSRRLLIGSKGQGVDVLQINRQFAHCSFSFFISAHNNASVRELAPSIGGYIQHARQYAQTEDCSTSARGRDGIPMARNRRIPKVITRPGRAGRLAQTALTNLCLQLIGRVSLDRVVQIVVVPHIVEALTSLRGAVPMLEELDEVRDGCIEPVRTGDFVELIVLLPETMAEALTLKDARALVAARVVRHLLGRASYSSDLMIRLEGHEESPQQLWTVASRTIALQAASSYVGGIVAIGNRTNLGADVIAGFVSSARDALRLLGEVRHRADPLRDVDGLVRRAQVHIAQVLGACATTAGLLQSASNADQFDRRMEDLLVEFNLADWWRLYKRDLHDHYARRNCWTSLADLDQLATHVERIGWSVGILMGAAPNGIAVDLLDDVTLKGIESSFNAPYS